MIPIIYSEIVTQIQAEHEPLCSVDDCDDSERDRQEEAVVQAQQDRRCEGHQPDGLRGIQTRRMSAEQ